MKINKILITALVAVMCLSSCGSEADFSSESSKTVTELTTTALKTDSKEKRDYDFDTARISVPASWEKDEAYSKFLEGIDSENLPKSYHFNADNEVVFSLAEFVDNPIDLSSYEEKYTKEGLAVSTFDVLDKSCLGANDKENKELTMMFMVNNNCYNFKAFYKDKDNYDYAFDSLIEIIKSFS